MPDLDLDAIELRAVLGNRGPTGIEGAAFVAEVRRLRAENAELAAAVRALNDTVNELAILFEDHTGAPPHISTGVVEPQR